jgi:hypothetical protein
MKIFELVVSPGSYELRCPDEIKKLKFPTLLSAFTYAQLAMAEENAEILVHAGAGMHERLPLYRMTA